MLMLFPVNFVITMVIRKWQIEQMHLKDERTKMVNEVLNGIKVIKLYAWEPPMERVINELRERELRLIRKGECLRTLSDILNSASPFLVCYFHLDSDSKSKLSTFFRNFPLNCTAVVVSFLKVEREDKIENKTWKRFLS